ncbi:MAG: MATE family efflux transporter [Clostridia bacterium]|nr:MATE family efflux transporter [Clostridia bacterium]
MEKELSRDLLEGDVTQKLLKLSVPTMLGFLFQSGYEIIDMIWIGRISSNAIAGVTIFISIFWMVDVLNTIIGNSSISLISQNYGTGSKENTSIAIEQTITFKGLVAIIAAIIVLLTLKPALHFFTSDPEVIQSALSYGYLRVFFLPILFSSFTVNTAFRCLGEGRKPMIAMVIAAIFNLVLDPVLMFDIIPGTNLPGFGMGVFGASLATVISTVVAFLVAFFMLIRQKDKVDIQFRRMFKLNKAMDYQLMTIGLPNGLEMLTRNVSGLITLKLVQYYGTAAVATLGIGIKLFNFGFMPLIGLTMGAGAMTGQALGDENIERAEKTVKTAARIGFMVATFFGILAIAFAENIMHVFTTDTEVITLGAPMIRIFAPSLMVLAIGFGFGAVFNASGYNLPYFIATIISKWVFHVPVLVLGVVVLKWPIAIVWLTYLLSDTVEVIAIVSQYKIGKWRTKRVYSR